MSKFRNDTPNTITFDMSGQFYKFEPGEEIFIPDRIAYGVKSRGLPLTLVEGPREEPAKRGPCQKCIELRYRPCSRECYEAAGYPGDQYEAVVAKLEKEHAEEMAVAAKVEAAAGEARAMEDRAAKRGRGGR